MKLAAAALILLALPVQGAAQAQAQTQAPDRITAIESAWRGWLSETGIAHSTLAIGHAGAPVHAAGQGWAPDRPGTLASLSKSITGACALALINSPVANPDNTRLTFDTVFPGTDLTLAEILTHRTGLAPDQTQGAMAGWRGQTTPRHAQVSATALARPDQQAARGNYHYNNENYALAGAMIDASAGDYATACRAAVLAPAGVTTASLSPEFGAYAAWGGWQMSGPDMIRFIEHAYGPATDYGADPFAHPHAPLDDSGLAYGLGTFVRPFREGHNFWHFGLLCFADRGEGSFFARWEANYSVTIFFDTCPDWPALGALDAALVRAVYD